MENGVANSLIFANARIKSLEQKLLSSERITRMVDSLTLADAMRILQEVNYGNGITPENPADFDLILLAEQKDVTAFIRSLLPDGYGVDALLIKNDYHNAKAFMKAKYSSIGNLDELLQPYGIIPVEIFKESIDADNYEKLPTVLAEALQQIDLIFAEKGKSPQVIDIVLDKAYYRNVFEILEKSKHCPKNSVIYDFFIKNIDYLNISTFYRAKLCKLSIENFEEMYIIGGKLSLDFFKSIFEKSIDEIITATHYNDFRLFFEKLSDSQNGAIVSYEIYMENELLSIFRNDKSNMFSISPICGYYLGKLTEIKIARIILVGIKNGIDKSIIRSRLREVYA